MKKPIIYGIRVSYNDKFLLRLKRRNIKEKQKEPMRQKKQ